MDIKRGIAAVATIVGLGLLVRAVPAVAHHSDALFYDAARTVEAQGPVTKFVFKNPHATLYFESTGENAQKVEWQVELGPPASLVRTGWTPDTLVAGTVIKVAGRPSRAEGTYGMCCAKITRADGSPIVPGGRVQEGPSPR